MTKKETINLLIDVLMGNKEVEDMQIFVDFLTHERELLEKKSSNSGQTKTQKENETIKEKIVETLRDLGKYVTITEIQNANVELGTYSNQKISALLKQLVDNKEIEKVIDVVTKPLDYDLPKWILNRQKDTKDGSYTQQVANNWDTKMREDLERMKKMKLHKGLRHYFGLRVRGQHTCSTGRRGKTVGVSKKK